MSRIDDLKSEITSGDGLALANRYRVFLPPVGGVSARSLDLLCKNVSIPGLSLIHISEPTRPS